MMKRKYYKRNADGAIYYTGKDQKDMDNLINIRTGSEMFIPGLYYGEEDYIHKTMLEIPKEQALREVPDPYGNHKETN